MTILAGAVIISLNDTNIFDRANEAVDATNLKQVQVLAQTIWADAYLDNIRSKTELENYVLDKLEENGIDKDAYKISVTEDGVEVSLGYEKNGDTVIKNDKTYNIGEYVNYDCLTGVEVEKLKYTTSEAQTGTFATTYDISKDASGKSVADNVKWQIMGATNGNLLLLGTINTNKINRELILGGKVNATVQQIHEMVYLNNEAGYINGPTIINNIAAIYGHGKGAIRARAFSIEDLNDLVGYKPLKAPFSKDTLGEYGSSVTVTFKQDANGTYIECVGTNGKTHTNYTAKFRYFDETSKTFKDLAVGQSTTITNGHYSYNLTDYLSTSSTIYNMVVGDYIAKAGDIETIWFPSTNQQVAVSKDSAYGYYAIPVLSVKDSLLNRYTRVYSDEPGPNGKSTVRVVVEIDGNVNLDKQIDGTYNIEID